MKKIVLSLENTVDNQKLIEELALRQDYQVIDFSQLETTKATSAEK